MATITCPWCEEEVLPVFVELDEAEVSFTCADCGTSVAYVEEPTVPLALAA